MSRVSFMEPGMCHRKLCFNTGPRCGKGHCEKCCRAFHEHGLSSGSPGVKVVASNISTAIQPTPPTTYTYEPGQVQLVRTENIQSLRRG